VEDQEIELVRTQRNVGFHAIFHPVDRMARVAQRLAQHCCKIRVVFGDQNAHRLPPSTTDLVPLCESSKERATPSFDGEGWWSGAYLRRDRRFRHRRTVGYNESDGRTTAKRIRRTHGGRRTLRKDREGRGGNQQAPQKSRSPDAHNADSRRSGKVRWRTGHPGGAARGPARLTADPGGRWLHQGGCTGTVLPGSAD